MLLDGLGDSDYLESGGEVSEECDEDEIHEAEPEENLCGFSWKINTFSL